LLMALAQRQRLGRLNEAAGAVRIFLEIHIFSLGLFLRAAPAGAWSTPRDPRPLS
jgi:hypothetical protein